MPRPQISTKKLQQVFNKAALDLKTESLFIALVLADLEKHFGYGICWDINKIKSLYNFTTSHPSVPLYKGRDARPLLLAVSNTFKSKEEQILIRAHNCKCRHCINPTHYFYGDRLDNSIEKWRRSGVNIDRKIYNKIVSLRKESPKFYTYGKLSEIFNLSSRTIRTICTKPDVTL